MWAICLAEDLLTSQERLCTMKLIITYVLYTCTSRFLPVAAHSFSPPVCPLRDHMVPDPVICVYEGGCMFVTVTMF
jgi:hypothetical protein